MKKLFTLGSGLGLVLTLAQVLVLLLHESPMPPTVAGSQFPGWSVGQSRSVDLARAHETVVPPST